MSSIKATLSHKPRCSSAQFSIWSVTLLLQSISTESILASQKWRSRFIWSDESGRSDRVGIMFLVTQLTSDSANTDRCRDELGDTKHFFFLTLRCFELLSLRLLTKWSIVVYGCVFDACLSCFENGVTHFCVAISTSASSLSFRLFQTADGFGFHSTLDHSGK